MNNDDKHASSLLDFYKQLTVGNPALSLRSRKEMALADYAPLAERVKAGDATAFEDFKAKAQVLLEIEREIHGSQIGYFDRLAEVTSLTRAALEGPSLPENKRGGRHDSWAPPPASSALSTWWGNLASKDQLDEAQCLKLARQAFPSNHVSRQSIRDLRGPQKRGPKCNSQPHGET